MNEVDIVVVQPEQDSKYSLFFGQIHVDYPTIIEEDRTVQMLLPHIARQRNLTYDSTVYVDVKEMIEINGQKTEVFHYKRIPIFKLPMMLLSDKCNLNKYSKSERVSIANECGNDHGGYFIIRGTERSIIGQSRANHNQPIVLNQKVGEKYKSSCDVRSMSEETGHSVLVQVKIGVDDRTIVFSIPYIKECIPVGILFKALGISEKEIENIIGNKDNNIEISRYIKYIIRDSFFIKTQEEALSYISDFTIHIVKDENKIKYVSQTVENELLPHMGIFATIKEKCFFLGNMVNKLLCTTIGLRKEDDRDNYANKRVEVTGVLFCELFRTLFKRFAKSIEMQIEKKKQRPDILSIISRTNSITTGLRTCMSTGNWSVSKTNYVRTGVSQVLSRLTYGATLSHLRRFVIPIGKEGKNAKIRQIHSSQIMYICPTETPEGQSIGIVMNLALQTSVTRKIPTVVVKEIIENSDNLIFIHDYEGVNDKPLIFLNGILMGITLDPTSFIEEMRSYRSNGLLDKEVSITFYDNDIRIFCDEGRFIRPLLTVNKLTNRVNIEKKDTWDNLVEKQFIQYLDNSEIQNCVIAMDNKDLLNYKCDFCEICPAMILGVMASSIPFPDHNQSPRNIYQASMGKQALGFYASSYQVRTDTITYILDYPQKSLVSTIPADLMGFNEMPSGINAIVAICCYTGFNQEDSLLINQSSVDRGLFGASAYRTITDEEKKQGTYNYETITMPPINKRKKNCNYSFLDENGLVKLRMDGKSIYVEKGDVIIGKVLTKSNKNGEEELIDNSYVIKNGEEGYITRILQTVTPNGYKMIKVTICTRKIPEVGDKFASRSAQKGTCGLLVPQEDMPFTRDGITPDLLINSHCIPSRMTVSQLLETVLGKACCFDGTLGDATPFTSNSKNIAESICSRLQKYGYERHGNESLINGMTGEPIDAQIFIGPCFYQRLKHMVSDKIHSRSQGPVTTLHRQPLEGRSRDGGLRFGEMERDCIISHGAAEFLKERLFLKSDPYQIDVCDLCGNIATTNTECKACDTDKITKCNLPYASKLLINELQAMSIKISIKSDKNKKH